jgi:dipeptidase
MEIYWMTDITQMLKRREELQRRKDLQASPEEQMEQLAAIQSATLELLRSSPEGYQHFLRRNYKSRRAEVIDGTWCPVSASY